MMTMTILYYMKIQSWHK